MIRIGQQVTTQFAEFRVLARLNQGALGEIYLAEVVKTRRRSNGCALGTGMKAAIKVPRLPEGLSHYEAVTHYLPTLAKSLIVEAHALSQLRGLPCIPKYFGSGATKVWFKSAFGSEPIETQFLAMEFLPGQSLDKYLIDRFGSRGEFTGVPTANDFFKLAKQLAAQLLAIHRKQVVHGDLWPRNIMYCSELPKFIDFGQAVRRDLSPGGFVQKLGSHSYLPPDGSGEEAGDIYAIAGVLFYLATGTAPPKGIECENQLKAMVLAEIRRINPGLIKENRGIADIIARGLRINKHRRLKCTDILMDDLKLFEPVSVSTRSQVSRSIQDHLSEWEKKRHIDALAGGMYDAFRSDDEVSTFMCRILSFLKPGDRYSTVSMPRFWRQGNVGHDGRFMSMNIVKALQGVEIERVILLRQSDLAQPEVIKMLKAQLAAVDEFGASRGVKRHPRNSGAFSVCATILSDDDFVTEISGFSHAGLIWSGNQGSVVFSSYDSDERISSCRVQPGQGLYKTQYRKFEQLHKNSRPLMDLRHLLGS